MSGELGGSSRNSRLKKRAVSLSPPASSRKRLCSPGDNPGRVVPGHHADNSNLPPTTLPQRPSASTVPVSYTTNPIPAYLSASRLEGSSSRNNSLMHLPLPSPPLLPDYERQALSYQGRNQMFGGAHDFVMNNAVFNDYNAATDNFMKELWQETIIGAEFDSSARDPPPRCHPGTRLAIIQRCLDFTNKCDDEGRLRWVVGPAGVGKSAVMQMVTETSPEGVIFASIFLSVNGRRDGKKAIITIAYQFAVKCGPYRSFIRDQISLDPSLLHKSLSVQFNKFIVEPFMFKCVVEPSRRFLVVIDGLDECDNHSTQRELLKLITDFCVKYPASPIAWIIASRPEPHITSFFNKAEVQPAYIKEEMVIDSDEACDEVQRYLRDELKNIKDEHPTLSHRREWPLEHEFTKIASAAGGLFAYAATVNRYIGDSTHGGPAAQLRRVLETIDASAKDRVAGRDNPMDQLDALYKRILSNVPDNVMINTRKLLILRSSGSFVLFGFRGLCNALGLTEDDAYDAVSHLPAVLKIPEPDEADNEISYYHKSFRDFLSDFKRSGFSHDFRSESHELWNHISSKIMKEVQDDSGVVAGGEDIEFWEGLMKGHHEIISLSWPCDGRFRITDEDMRISLYSQAMRWFRFVFETRLCFKSISGFHALTTRVTIPYYGFPFYGLRDCAFDHFRHELVMLGKLKQVPLRTLDYAAVCGELELRFTSSNGSNIGKASDHWDVSCEHEKEEFDGLQGQRGWSTVFNRYCQIDSVTEDDEDRDILRFYVSAHQQGHQEWIEYITGSSPVACIDCSRHFARRFMNNPDQLAMVFIDSTQMCYVEVSFVDPDDDVSQWRYRFLHSGCPTNIDA